MNGHSGLENGDGGGEEEESVRRGGGGAVAANINDPFSSSATPSHQTKDFPTRKRESMILYHNVVLDNIIDSEGAFVNDMQALISTVLIPLRLRCSAPIVGRKKEEELGEEDQGIAEEKEEKDVGLKEDAVCSSLPNNLASGKLGAFRSSRWFLRHWYSCSRVRTSPLSASPSFQVRWLRSRFRRLYPSPRPISTIKPDFCHRKKSPNWEATSMTFCNFIR